MKVQELYGRIELEAGRFSDEVKKGIMKDYLDDIELMKKDIITNQQVADKWAGFVHMRVKK